MKNLQITARLGNSFVTYEDWTPQLEGILVRVILENLHLASPNPSHEVARENKAIAFAKLPLKITDGVIHCSSPVYRYKKEEIVKFRKRWDPDRFVDWGKRKPKVDTAQGAEKSYDLPLFARLTSRIDWFCVGDQEKIMELLQKVTGLGKKRSQGYGQIIQWEAKGIEEDWSLSRNKKLMKTLPLDKFKELGLKLEDYPLMTWGWQPPVFLPENKVLCVMPEVVSVQ